MERQKKVLALLKKELEFSRLQAKIGKEVTFFFELFFDSFAFKVYF